MAATWQSGRTTCYNANASETSALTAGAGEFYRIRHIRLINNNGTTQGVAMAIGSFVGGRTFRTTTKKIVTGDIEDFYPGIWITPGQTINVQTDIGNGMLITFDYDVYT